MLSVDCSNVELVSSTTLGGLTILHRRLKQKKGRLMLYGVRAELRRLLERTKLDGLFEIEQHDPAGLPLRCRKS